MRARVLQQRPAEAERETTEYEAQRAAAREASLKAMTKDQRYYARNAAKRMADSAAYRAGDAVPPWLTAEQEAANIAVYQQVVDLSEIAGGPFAGDHFVPLVGISRKTWLATRERKQVVCGLHVPWNLRAISQDMNREKKDWFDSDWPAPSPDDGDDDIPW
ncbi:MAG: hypothetical protein B7Z02_03245 [Rhodobacterales bacterium 32-67-9]|nr:MAG: hypothetical protein B7Z02_03245 [Rhodobacterales bacterium 32-67-9]